MKVLVTGGAGYIGSVVVHELARRGDEVIVADNFVQGHREAVQDVADIRYCDIRALGLVGDILREVRPDALIHLAALVAVADSMADPGEYYAVNGLGTFNVLEAMRTAQIDKLVFASSAAVYGDQSGSIKEDAPLLTTNPYGQTKMWGEQMIEGYCRAHGLNATCFRFFNVAGATQENGEAHEPETHLFPNIVKAILEERPVPIYGGDYPTRDGTALRDFVHVVDIARAHIMALDRLSGFQLYNLGTSEGYTCLEVAKAFEAAVGKPVAYDILPRRDGDIAGLMADPDKAAAIGWYPTLTLADMAALAWAWASAHPRGYDA